MQCNWWSAFIVLVTILGVSTWTSLLSWALTIQEIRNNIVTNRYFIIQFYKTNTLDTTITDVESSANYVDSLEVEAETKRVLAIAYLMTNYSLTFEEAITYIAGGYSYQCLALSFNNLSLSFSS